MWLQCSATPASLKLGVSRTIWFAIYNQYAFHADGACLALPPEFILLAAAHSNTTGHVCEARSQVWRPHKLLSSLTLPPILLALPNRTILVHLKDSTTCEIRAADLHCQQNSKFLAMP